MTKALLPQLSAAADAGNAAVVNVGSIEGIGANPLHTAYSASKGGVHGLTAAMAVDLGPLGIRCNAVAPGWMDTEWLDKHVPDEVAGQVRSGEVPSVPVTEVAALAIELLRNDALSGQTVVVDAGELWRR